MSLPNRKKPAYHSVIEKHGRANIHFLTVCSHRRKRILANDAVHHLLIESWAAADHWLVGRYVIMPDHIHLFCAPAKQDYLSIKRWVAYWKSYASRKWPAVEEQPIWQLDVWDRQLRTGDSYSEKWSYVRNNPVRAGLATASKDWPYSSELNVLHWHD